MLRTMMLVALLAKPTAGTSIRKYYIVQELGTMRVTKYTHNEGGWWTSSGYKMRASDKGTVCAVSRDLLRTVVFHGDSLYVDGIGNCMALDTMADKNRRGFRQRKWIDVFNGSDVKEALDFGIQKRKVYVIRRAE